MAEGTDQAFARLAARPDDAIDLAEGALLIAAEADPAPDRTACLARLDAMAAEAAGRLADTADAHGRVAALSRYLFDELGFRGNSEDYYDPRNSFLHEVLARRTGIPITLALVYLELGRRIGLPLAGVNFPAHFLVRHTAPGAVIVVDPFTGDLLDEAGCAALLRSLAGADAPFDPAMLEAVPPRQILRRMLTNLKHVDLQRGDLRRALTWTRRILQLVPDAPLELRDRGLLHHRLECYPEAQADLERFLELAGDAPESEAVRACLEAARARAGRLN